MPNPDDLIQPSDRPQANLRQQLNAIEPQRQAGADAVRQRIADVAARQAQPAVDLRQQITSAAPQQQADARAVAQRMAAGPTPSPLRQQLLDAEPQRQAQMRAVAQRITPPTLTDVIQPGNVNPSLRDDLARNAVQAQNDAKTVQARLNAGSPPAQPSLRETLNAAAPRQAADAQAVAQRMGANTPAGPDLRAQLTAAAPQAQADAQAVAQRMNANAPAPLRERLLARAAAAPSAAEQAFTQRMGGGSIAQAASQAVPAATPNPAAQLGAGVAGASGRAGVPAASPATAPAPATPAQPAATVRDAGGRPVPTRVPGVTGNPAPTPSAGSIRPDVGSMRASLGLPPTPPGAASAAGAGATAAGVAGAAGRAAGASVPPPGAVPPAPAAAAAPAAAETAGAGANASRLARAAYAVGNLAGRAMPVAARVLPAAAGVEALTHFNDYKLNEPGVDSSAGGTLKALFTGDFAGAGKSLLKGGKEAAMDLGSAAANLADYVVPGTAPVSRAYDQMLHEKLGDKLVPHASVIADMARNAPAAAPAKPAAAPAAPAAAKPAAPPAATKADKPAAAPEAAKPAAKPAAAPAPQPNLSNMAANARDEALAAIDNEEGQDPRAVYYQTYNHNDGTTTYETRDRGQIVVKDGQALNPEDQQRVDAFNARQQNRDGIEQRYQQMLSQLQGEPQNSGPVADAARGGGNAHVAAFVQQYGEAAKAAGDKLGIDPNVLLTQWGHETGWGKSVIPGTNNLGNIKAVKGQAGVAATDNMTGARDNYAQYASPHEFADQYVNLVQSRYPNAVGAGSDMARFASALKAGGYAEDPAYVNKLQAAYRTMQGVGSAQPQAAALSPREVRDPLAGAVQVIDMNTGTRSVTWPGMGNIYNGMSQEGYDATRAALAKNPQLAQRLQVTDHGPMIDGVYVPANVMSGGDGAVAQYASSVGQGQRFAANPAAAKLADTALQGEMANRGHQIAAGGQERVATIQSQAQKEIEGLRQEGNRYITAGGGVNQETGQPMPTNIYDKTPGKPPGAFIPSPHNVPPKAVAIQQARESLKRGGRLEDVNAVLQSYGYEPITK